MAITRTNYILVDFENVQQFDLARFVGMPVKVFLFLGENQKNISREILKQVCDNPGVLCLVESVGSGRNALDFQISLYAGMLAERDKEAYIHFLSGDKGFDVLVESLRQQKRYAARAGSFEDLKFLKASSQNAELATDEKARFVAEKIAKGTKPRKRSTLESTISTLFGPDAQTSEIIESMTKQRLIQIGPDLKVTYF